MGTRMASDSHPNVYLPCAGCKLLRRRCTEGCVFAPHFPSTEPEKFRAVHLVFGASNVSKMLKVLPADLRGDAVTSLVYEANARLAEPVYGCVSSIAALQIHVSQLQDELTRALSETMTLRALVTDLLCSFSSAVNTPVDVGETAEGTSIYQLMSAPWEAWSEPTSS